MKLLKSSLLVVLLAASLYAQPNTSTADLKTLDDSVSYSIGVNIGKNLNDPNMKIAFDVLIRGIKDAVSGKYLLTDQQIQEIMMAFNQRIMAQRNEAQNALKEKNKKEGEAFLEANKQKEGVKVLPSGLQYKVLLAGKGASPKIDDKVKVHYKGSLINGKVFDSSYDRGEPALFGLTQVIKGWTEALQLMKEGDKFEIYIPSELAYGENGSRNVIGPNEVLIFEVELLEVIKEVKK